MNRTGTYVAFDGLGQSDPTKSDFRYYSLLQAWNNNQKIDFIITNSHEKTYAVRDTSLVTTLYARIRERLSVSKNMVIILSEDTRKSGSVLSYEIEQAIDKYKIPLIITYPTYSTILSVGDELSAMWPTALSERINQKGTEAVHISFKKEPLMDAIPRFSVNGEHLSNGKIVYTRESYIEWGLLSKPRV